MSPPTSSPGSGFWNAILGWLPAWLGFVFGLAAGVILIIIGAVGDTERAGLIALGVATILSVGIAWWSGTSAEPRLNPKDKSLGAYLSRIEQIPWLIILGLFVIAVIIFLAT
jgi:hypothetical protein